MFTKILIANRGEIAARIIRTCKRMGVATVAIYSEADVKSPYVRQADEAYLVGGPRVPESYLNQEKIIELALQSGAKAIHPGYGFLSENASFAQKCVQAGLIFIGPTIDAIEAMGDKVRAREFAESAGVPVVPGVTERNTTAEQALEAAKKTGYPVMLKASAGGGGVGMQVANTPEELISIFSSNQKRSEMFFGNGDMFVEKYLEQPRHIEIQVLADQYGNTVYLGERECSIQRRHQKIIEEAPSPFVDEELRLKLGELALRLTKKINYTNAGTVEFLVDDQRNIYFLEMNTRLQVEHPITEEVYGIDLVEQQLRIASGEKLLLSQEMIASTGHAIETRIYAEDPIKFFPSPGTVTSLDLPRGTGIRHELGFENGMKITPFYDPMIAKLIVYGETRTEAITRMETALSSYKISGIKTNLPLLIEVIRHEAFQSGKTTTHFLTEHPIHLLHLPWEE